MFIGHYAVAMAAKRADREASEGMICIKMSDDQKTGVILELNCETDFVGRNDEFVALSKQMAAHVLQDTAVDGLVTVGAEGAYLATPYAFEAGRSVGEAYFGPIAIQPGEQITTDLIGPSTTVYVDATRCNVLSPT